MRLSAFLLSSAILISAMSSCDKHEIDIYTGVDAIFFDQQHKGDINETWLDTVRLAHQNYTVVNFNTIQSKDSTLRIKIETTGYVRDYDRPFKVEVVPDSTTAVEGVEFEVLNPELSILPGNNSTHLEVALHLSDDMYTSMKMIQLVIIPGDHFALPFGEKGIGKMPLRYGYEHDNIIVELGKNENPAYHDIFVTAQLTKPNKWPLTGNMYSWGEFSVKKYQVILSCVEKYGWNVWHFENKMPQERYGIVARATSAYLTEQFNKGREYWVLDEDGSLMWVKGCSWSPGVMPDELIEK